MGKKNGVPRQAENTWRLVVDFTDEQATEYRELMVATNNSAAHILELMRIGKAQVDGYVYVKEDEPWKGIQFQFGKGHDSTLTCGKAEAPLVDPQLAEKVAAAFKSAVNDAIMQLRANLGAWNY